MPQRTTAKIQEVLSRPFDFVIVGSSLSSYSEMQLTDQWRSQEVVYAVLPIASSREYCGILT